MRKYIFIFAVAATAFIFYSFTVFNQPGNEVSPPGKNGLAIPDDVQQIINNHCFGCHNSDSKNEKSRKKLKFDKLTNLNKAKQIGKLGKIADVIKNDEMPPEKFLQKRPKFALSADQKTTLANWAESTAKSLAH